MPRHSPTLRRRRLSLELARLREAAGHTAQHVDEVNGWTRGKTARIERGEWVLPNLRDVSDLLDLYGVTDDHQRDELLTWARQGRERGWWHPYRAMLSESYTTYIGLEAEAATLRVFELAVIPGILQTPDYARALMRRRPGELPPETIDDRVEVRLSRQQILTGDDPARLRVIIDEAALRRAAGGAEVMRAQMEHLLRVAELPKVELQVIPFSAGTHAGTQGPFTILEFPDPSDQPAVYTENVAGEFFVERPEEVERFQLAFERLTAMAASPEDTIKLVEQTAVAFADLAPHGSSVRP